LANSPNKELTHFVQLNLKSFGSAFVTSAAKKAASRFTGHSMSVKYLAGLFVGENEVAVEDGLGGIPVRMARNSDARIGKRLRAVDSRSLTRANC
jgi:hypothetical protein